MAKQQRIKSIQEMIEELDMFLPNYQLVIESRQGRKRVRQVRVQ